MTDLKDLEARSLVSNGFETWTWGWQWTEPLREILEGPMLNRHARRKEAALKRRKK